jgi:phage-related minor tail protein
MPVIDRLDVEVDADLAPLRQAFAEAERLATVAAGDLSKAFAGEGEAGIFGALADGVTTAAKSVRGALVDALSGAEVEWDRVIGRMARHLSDLALDAALEQTLSSLVGSAEAGSGLADIAGSLFGGFRAGGGPVAPDRAYVVGEAGPELFVPGLAGAILPQGTATAAMPPVIVNISTPDAASFRQSQGQVAAAVGRALMLARRYS